MSCMALSERIQLEQGKRHPSEITELNLDRSKGSSIEGLTDDFVKLESLSLVNVGLDNLDGLPCLPSLKTLELSGNSISGGLEHLAKCPKLERLNLSSNMIVSVDSLTPLAKLSCLRSLDLSNCGVTELENYRKTVFAALPNLKFLDGADENNESGPESENPKGDVLNGVTDDANGTDDDVADDDDDDEQESDDDDDDEEEYGIEALQRSDDLEDDDEEDYVPEDEADLDDDDDIDDEEDDVEEDDGANLSGAGVTGSRRPTSKRRLEDGADEASAAKHKPDTESATDQ